MRHGIIIKEKPKWVPGVTSTPLTERNYPQNPDFVVVDRAIFHPKKVTHVALVTGNFEEMFDYYVDIMGLSPLAGDRNSEAVVLRGTASEGCVTLYRKVELWLLAFIMSDSRFGTKPISSVRSRFAGNRRRSGARGGSPGAPQHRHKGSRRPSTAIFRQSQLGPENDRQGWPRRGALSAVVLIPGEIDPPTRPCTHRPQLIMISQGACKAPGIKGNRARRVGLRRGHTGRHQRRQRDE